MSNFLLIRVFKQNSLSLIKNNPLEGPQLNNKLFNSIIEIQILIYFISSIDLFNILTKLLYSSIIIQ